MQKNYNINEIAKLFNITTNKIRFYEKKGLLKPLRDENSDYRKFDNGDILKLQAILLYRSIGLSIEDIRDILKNSNNDNYLKHFNNQWEIINSEIHRLNHIRNSIGEVIDIIYESNNLKINESILDIVRKNNQSYKLKENWKDKWDFDSWADSYDEDVSKDITTLKIYKNYDFILNSVYKLVEDSGINNPYILEIGVGTGNLSGRFLKNNYNIIGIDQSREMLNAAKEKYPDLKVRLGEFLKIPFNDKSFDVIVSTYAFHHLNVEEKVIAIEEMLRVLKDDGKIIIGDLMFKNHEDKQNILKKLSKEQIEEVNCEYYSYVDILQDKFKKFNKASSFTKIDDLNYIIMVQ